MEVKQKLVFDIGMHKGEDTTYYLQQGCTVLAVEANPQLASLCKEKFKDAINAGRLTILNAGIAKDTGNIPFYINLDNSEWSSFDKGIGTRSNSRFEIAAVSCVTTKSLFEQYGMPFYMKVDIEGNDFLCLNDIPATGTKPPYVSCEAVHIEWLDILYQKGYRRFKLINQGNSFRSMNLNLEKSWYYPYYRKIKGGVEKRARRIIKFTHLPSSSGPFGENTKGKWKTYEEVRKMYIDYYQGDLNEPVNNVSWWDFHAAL